jgi:hypothetical protein
MAFLLLMCLPLMSLLSPFFVLFHFSCRIPGPPHRGGRLRLVVCLRVGCGCHSKVHSAALRDCVPVRSPNDFVQSRCLDHHPNGVVPVSGRGIVRGTLAAGAGSGSPSHPHGAPWGCACAVATYSLIGGNALLFPGSDGGIGRYDPHGDPRSSGLPGRLRLLCGRIALASKQSRPLITHSETSSAASSSL